LLSILGEVPLSSGTAKVIEGQISGSVGYAPQQPFILNASIRENITFGRPFDESRYKRVLQATRLEDDISKLTGGQKDETKAGDQGRNLSGGQQARLNLARALYGFHSLYLFDDSFSAVDMQIAKEIYDEILSGRDKELIPPNATIVIATHQIIFALKADLLLVCDNGHLVAAGPPKTVLKGDADNQATQDGFLQFLQRRLGSNLPAERDSGSEKVTVPKDSQTKNRRSIPQPKNDGDTFDTSQEAGDTSIRPIPLRIYAAFLTVGLSRWQKFTIWPALFMLLLLSETCNFLSANWMKEWAASGPTHRNMWLFRFCVAVLTNNVVTCIRAFAFFLVMLKLSQNLYATMFESIINSKVSWFATAGPGLIFNVFTKDIATADQNVPRNVLESIS